MKKTLVALAALAVTSAFAQSTVTLSGVLDVGVFYRNTNKENKFPAPVNFDNVNSFGMVAGSSNRITFSGVEDLGGGLAATFAASMRFSPGDGGQEAGTRPIFHGESTVGLRGGFGAFKMGRWLTALSLVNGGTVDPGGVTTVALLPYFAGFASSYESGGEARIGNALFYSTPNFGGFSGNLSLGLAKGFTGKTSQSISGAYNNGPVNAFVGYERNNAGDRMSALGANYDLGVAKLYAGYFRVKGGTANDRLNQSFLAGTSSAFGFYSGGLANGTSAAAGQGVVAPDGTINTYTIAASVPLGAATLRAGFLRSRGDVVGAVRTDADSKLGLGVSYALSKRTSVYTDVASATNNKVLANGVAGTKGARSTTFDLGIVHSF